MRLRQILIPGKARRKLRAELVALLETEQPSTAALKYRPSDQGSGSLLVSSARDSGPLCPLGRPIPEAELWLGYGSTAEEYLESGRADIERMRSVLSDTGFEISTKSRILDFGCGAGRMIRWLEREAMDGEVWGCDISAVHIQWAQRNLRPPFHFLTCTMLPALPYSDDKFDLVYAGSVFTHIGDMAQGWLLELRRIIRPGGRAYLTVHDRHTEALMKTPAYSWVHASKLLAEYGGLPDDLGNADTGPMARGLRDDGLLRSRLACREPETHVSGSESAGGRIRLSVCSGC